MILAFFKLYFSPPNSVYLYPADVFTPFCRSSPSSLRTGQLVLPLVQLNLAGARALVYAVHKLGNAILTADSSAASLEAFKST